MTRSGMSFRIISKAFWFRPAKLSASLGALTVGATLASAFLSLYFVLPAKMSGEFQTLGPNLVLAPRDNDQTFSGELYTRLRSRQPGALSVPWLYAIGKGGGADVVMGGTDLAQLGTLNPGWKVIAGGSEPGVSLEEFLKKIPSDPSGSWLLA